MEKLESIRVEDVYGRVELVVRLSNGSVAGLFEAGEPGQKTAWELERMAARIRRGILEREGKGYD